MKLHIQALHSFGSILADESGCEVARTSTEGCDPHGRQYVDAPDLAETIAHRVNCHDELVAALEALFEHCAMTHNRWGDGCNQKEAGAAISAGRAALERAKQ